MAYEFKNLSDVDTLETVGDDTKILGLNAGNPVQIPASSMGGKVYLIKIDDAQFTQNDTVGGKVSNSETMGNEIIEAIRAGKIIWMAYKTSDPECWSRDFGVYIFAVDGQNYMGCASYGSGATCFFPTTYTSIFEE